MMTAQRSAVEAFSQTTKMATADVERSVESATVTVLKELDSIFSLKEEPTTALKAFVDKKDVSAILLIGFGKSFPVLSAKSHFSLL